MAEDEAGTAKCRFCGRDWLQGELTCSACGYNPLSDTCVPLDPRAEKKSVVTQSGGGKHFLLVLLIALSIAAAALVAFLFKDSLNSQGIVAILSHFKPINIIAKENAPNKNVSLGKMISDKIDKEKKKLFFVVEGIFYDGNGKSYVMVNGEVLGEGQSFKGVNVEKIFKNYIVVSSEGATKELGVSQEIAFPKAESSEGGA